MITVPIIPESAPFTANQRAWLNGFLAGVIRPGHGPAAESEPAKEPLLIVYGSQSGNSEGLAKRLAKEANGRGFKARACGMDTIQVCDLPQEKNLLVITSTWGEGEMPDNAEALWKGINANGSSPRLNETRYSVLALGDINYGETFCLAGRKVDERLEALGAVRVYPRRDCDVDFEEAASRWSAGALSAFTGAPVIQSTRVPAEDAPVQESGHHRGNPFPAVLLERRKLNGEGSSKDTRHLVFSLKGSGLVYETGDALGVKVKNCPEVVSRVIQSHGLDADVLVTTHKGDKASLQEVLENEYEVRSLLGATPKEGISAEEFVASLRKLNPRLYSIASSPRAHPDEVHLCVSVVKYEHGGLAHKGVASTYLSERCGKEERTGLFVHAANHFRIPENGSVPIIMVGPGTGIAPFRAFLQERRAQGSTGKNWLFFGDQYRASDYLYEDEIECWRKDKFLNRLDLAFSRDQNPKIYVQNRMVENGGYLWDWLEEGAHFYVCGDASRMAKDVDAALHQVIEKFGGRSVEDAADYVAEMKRSKRYARDVY